jgi:hypothetical protein
MSLNTQGNDNWAKLSCLSLSLTHRSIICCDETKPNTNRPFPKRINGNLLISSLPESSSKNGTSILIGKNLTPHIHESFNTSQYWCAIHLKFRPKIDIIITSIYLPHDKDKRSLATSSLISFLRKHKNKNHILCGNFNSYPKYAPAVNAQTTNFKRKIYNFLQSWIDVAKVTGQQNEYSHVTKTSMAQIDQI